MDYDEAIKYFTKEISKTVLHKKLKTWLRINQIIYKHVTLQPYQSLVLKLKLKFVNLE